MKYNKWGFPYEGMQREETWADARIKKDRKEYVFFLIMVAVLTLTAYYLKGG